MEMLNRVSGTVIHRFNLFKMPNYKKNCERCGQECDAFKDVVCPNCGRELNGV